MTERELKEAMSDSLAGISAAGVPFFFWAGGDDKSVLMVSPGLATMCKNMEPASEDLEQLTEMRRSVEPTDGKL